MTPFEYFRPRTVVEAAALLRDCEDAVPISGGMTLIPTLKQRLAPVLALVDLVDIPELHGIRHEGDWLHVGAMTTHAVVARSSLLARLLPGLSVLARSIGDMQVRNRGTIGGSLANNDPAADYPAGVLGLGAIIVTDRREIPAGEFFVGMFQTALESDEIIIGVRFPVPVQCTYEKFASSISGYALTGVFVARQAHGVHVAVTGAASVVFRSLQMEDALSHRFSPDVLDGVSIDPAALVSDLHASAHYRSNLVTVLTKRAIRALQNQTDKETGQEDTHGQQ